MKIIFGLILVPLTVAFLAGQAAAQDQPGLNNQQRLLERFDEDKLPKSTFDGDSPAEKEAITRSAAEQHRFTLKRIRFSGMTIYDLDDMRPMFADLIGSEISLAEILDVAERVERKYADNGYTTADVLLHKMPSANGVVTLSVIEKF